MSQYIINNNKVVNAVNRWNAWEIALKLNISNPVIIERYNK